MIRDRTNLYLAYRKTFPHHNFKKSETKFKKLPQEEEGLIQSNTDDIELSNLGNINDNNDNQINYTNTIQDIENKGNNLTQQIKQNMKQLGKKYKEVLLPQFDDGIVQGEMKVINELSNTITNELRMIYKVINELQKLDEVFINLETEEENSGFKDHESNKGIKGSRILVSNLKKKFAIVSQDLSGEFREMQGKYIRYLKKDEVEDIAVSNKTELVGGSSDVEIYSRNAMVESSNKQTQLQLQENTNDLDQQNLLEREREIYKISQNVVEISMIFKELENIVIDQGTILDNIEYNLDRTVDNVKDAHKQLNKAEKYQKQTRKCKIVMFLVLLIFLFLMLLMVKPRRVDHYVHEHEPKKTIIQTDTNTATTENTATNTEELYSFTGEVEPKLAGIPTQL